MKKLNPINSISNKVQEINYSSVRKAFSAGRKEGVINLTIGQPDFDVPDNIKKSAKKYIDAGFNRYTETKGVQDLRTAVSKYLFSKRIKRNEDEIIITSGTTAGIYMSLMAIINPGDEIIIFEPYFVAYKEIINLLGGKVLVVKTDDNFEPSITDLRKALTRNTKAIIVNSPNNPTGAVYSKENIKEIINLAKKNNIYIISDEIYSELTYGVEVFSPAKFYKKTIVLDGFSKSKGMTGWRVGFVAGPKEIIDAIEKIQQFSFVCAPAPFQYALIDSLGSKIDPKIIKRYKEVRDYLYNALKKDYKIVEPKGAFYFFIKTPIPGEKFAELLLNNNVAVVPGLAFGDNCVNYIRISFAIKKEILPKIIEAFDKIKKTPGFTRVSKVTIATE